LLPFAPDGYKRGVPFRRLLQSLVDTTRGARGAVFCDHEGEHVELALARALPQGCGELGEFELKICGAQMAAPLHALHEASAATGSGEPRELRMRCAGGIIVCRVLPGRYYLALLLAPGGRSSLAGWQLDRAARLVEREM
jgi:hypothetical protein